MIGNILVSIAVSIVTVALWFVCFQKKLDSLKPYSFSADYAVALVVYAVAAIIASGVGTAIAIGLRGSW